MSAVLGGPALFSFVASNVVALSDGVSFTKVASHTNLHFDQSDVSPKLNVMFGN